MVEQHEARRYRITAVLGEGGFGKVYRARLEGAGGFVKEVALKILREEELPPGSLRRFRDESRILGLVRDRAIVGVDPPCQLDGRWTIVMELVEGAHTGALIQSAGPVPSTVALEIVQEVARALDRAWHQAGPDGEPVQLVHRDLKPANVQITPAGEVKILDFGIARATFQNRESQTSGHVGGTIGYIAPERLDGHDGPESDVFALGVLMHKLVTGHKPTEQTGPHDLERAAAESAYVETLALSKEMRAFDPRQRPTAREVEDRCAELRAHHKGATLRRWAEEHVPRAMREERDGLVGSVLSETLPSVASLEGALGPSRKRARQQLLVAVSGASALSVGGLVLANLVALVGLGLWLGSRSWPQPAEAPSLERTPGLDEVLDEAPAVVEPPAEPEAPTAAPEPAPRPPPAPAIPTRPVSFGSVPMGAEVWLDGRRLGTTPLLDHPVPEGEHTLVVLGGDGVRGERSIEVGRRGPARYIFKEAEAAWEVHY